MSETEHINQRKAGARLATRRVMVVMLLWGAAMLALVLLSLALQRASGQGLYTHPPFILHVVGQTAAVVAGLMGVYVGLYLWWGLGRTKVTLAVLTNGVMLYALTLSALTWAVPALSLVAGSQPVEVTAVVRGASQSRNSVWGCRNRVSFGTPFAPRGGACVNIPKSSSIIGSTLEMTGHGNTWATRIETIEAVWSASRAQAAF